MGNDIITLGNRIIDKSGNVVYFSDALLHLMLKNEYPLEVLYSEDFDIKKYNELHTISNEHMYKLPEQIESFEKRRNTWFYPPEYSNIDLHQYFNELVTKYNNSEIYINRVFNELKLYEEKNMIHFLRFCIYFSDMIKKHNWVVSTGRGSSCCSLLLRLLEIHLVDPIEYELDIHDFLK